MPIIRIENSPFGQSQALEADARSDRVSVRSRLHSEATAITEARVGAAEKKAAAADAKESEAMAKVEAAAEHARTMSGDLEQARARLQQAEAALVTERGASRAGSDKLFAVQSEVARLQQKVGQVMAIEDQLRR